ncbi:hypothetical protein HBH82_134710 [Parastagonospora nodorum]|nr:hypothetical protein HBH82_134710 [Parastagonospora nodorum]KAH4705400.1 hypothetical protein HBH67_092980 [Parastagonospora nodorum]KAH4780455.1 hypothetical protein HBH62_132540 [Parastagonospora nodorum]
MPECEGAVSSGQERRGAEARVSWYRYGGGYRANATVEMRGRKGRTRTQRAQRPRAQRAETMQKTHRRRRGRRNQRHASHTAAKKGCQRAQLERKGRSVQGPITGRVAPRCSRFNFSHSPPRPSTLACRAAVLHFVADSLWARHCNLHASAKLSLQLAALKLIIIAARGSASHRLGATPST